jgi:hypothetical protein
MMDNEELKAAALALYKPPFRFIHGYIKDADEQTVADDAGEAVALRIRGWGRIQYMPHAEALQDTAGEIIAEALTEYWDRRAAPPVAEAIPAQAGELDKIIDKRDQYHDWADKLAEAIAKRFNSDIGEHSSANCPWTNALEIIEGMPAQVGTMASIDTQEFRAELNYFQASSGQKNYHDRRKSLIAHINAAMTAYGQQQREEGHNDMHEMVEQLKKEGDRLRGERDMAVERAEKAEAALTTAPLDIDASIVTLSQARREIARLRAELAAGSFQARVQPWMMACFGEMIAGNREERNHRFLEEALELVQACGCTASEAHQLVDYVYGRDVGEKAQEVGGVMVTLAALCLAQDLDMHGAGETELARIWTKVEAIRAKQAAKPKYGPLPGVAPAAACGICNDFGAAFGKRCVCATEKNQIKSEGKAA